MTCERKIHYYTEEEKAFFKTYVPGHSHKQIRDAFEERFGWDITVAQVRAYIKNHHLNTGRTGKFEKGSIPHNKGKKGTCAEGCKKTWFRTGHVPENHRPVGSERVNVEGYIEIKVAEPNVWKLKHRIVYEENYGSIPKGSIVLFRDGDKQNTSADNLILITRSVHMVLNQDGLCKYKGELKDTAIKIAELKCAKRCAEKKINRRNDK